MIFTIFISAKCLNNVKNVHEKRARKTGYELHRSTDEYG